MIKESCFTEYCINSNTSLLVFIARLSLLNSNTTGTGLGILAIPVHLVLASEICADNVDFSNVAGSEWLYLEGYLAMSPSVSAAIARLHDTAKAAGTKIAVSFADPAVVRFAKDGLTAMLARGVDAIFCNREEAETFAAADGEADFINALLKYSELVVVTNSDKPTTIARRGDTGIELLEVDSASVSQVLDTNGAGDNYAGAFLYGLTHGYDLAASAKLAASVSAKIIQQFGPRLKRSEYVAIREAQA